MRSATRMSLGHLIRASRADRLRHGDRGGERQQLGPARAAPATSAAPRPPARSSVRPWRPWPAVCSAAVTSVPCGAPAAASALARSLVESVRRRCSRGAAEPRSCRFEHDGVVGAEAEPRRRRAAVDGQRELSGRRPRRAAARRRPTSANVRAYWARSPVDADRAPEPSARCPPAASWATSSVHVAEAVDGQRVGLDAALARRPARAGRVGSARRRRSGRPHRPAARPPPGARRPARRCRGRGTWRPPARAGAASGRCRPPRPRRRTDGGGREQAVVGADEHPVLLARSGSRPHGAPRRPRDRRRRGAPRAACRAARGRATSAPLRTSWRRDAVGDVDDPRLGRDPGDDRRGRRRRSRRPARSRRGTSRCPSACKPYGGRVAEGHEHSEHRSATARRPTTAPAACPTRRDARDQPLGAETRLGSPRARRAAPRRGAHARHPDRGRAPSAG